MSNLWLWSSALVAVFIRLVIFPRFRRPNFVSKLSGPPASSWLVGNLPDIERAENVGDAEFKWSEIYGTALRFKGAFGRDILYTSDPKALQHLSVRGYNYNRPKNQMFLSRISSGKGIMSVDGLDHARHRKIMNPAFAYSPLMGCLPIFVRAGRKLSDKWRDIVTKTGNDSTTIDVAEWLPRLTLDAFGEAALNYEFGTLEDADNELSRVYRNLFSDTFFKPSDADIAFRRVFGYMPIWMGSILKFIPLSGMARIRNNMKVSFRVAKQLVDREAAAISHGKLPGRDAMSLLVRANSGENAKGRISDQELLAEMSTLMIAGHETTSSTMSFFLYELSRHPEDQQRIREETKAARDQAAARGDENLTATDLESMSFTVAALKETLRLHPIGPLISRTAGCDDTIPLSKPCRSVTGEVFTSIPVSKGQRVIMSVCAYNRLKDVWGDDAHEWNPERFLEGGASNNEKTALGVYANLATFGSGPRSCIGYRFAILEIQSVIMELLDNFSFALAPGVAEIVRSPTMVMTVRVKGQAQRGAQLPLKVTPL